MENHNKQNYNFLANFDVFYLIDFQTNHINKRKWESELPLLQSWFIHIFYIENIFVSFL